MIRSFMLLAVLVCGPALAQSDAPRRAHLTVEYFDAQEAALTKRAALTPVFRNIGIGGLVVGSLGATAAYLIDALPSARQQDFTPLFGAAVFSFAVGVVSTLVSVALHVSTRVSHNRLEVERALAAEEASSLHWARVAAREGQPVVPAPPPVDPLVPSAPPPPPFEPAVRTPLRPH